MNNKWTKPIPVFNDNWKIEGCPANGPKTANYNNNLTVVWYTEANEIPAVKLIFSKDNGATFDKPVLIDKIKAIGSSRCEYD